MTGLLLALITSTSSGLEPGAIISFPPLVGVVLSETETPGVALFLPWLVKLPEEPEQVLRPSQLVIEVGVVFRAVTAFTSRVALRWLRPALPWLAVGGGLGMGLEVGALTRAVSSLDLVTRLGNGPHGFGLVAARVELRMDGTTAWMLSGGLTYW